MKQSIKDEIIATATEAIAAREANGEKGLYGSLGLEVTRILQQCDAVAYKHVKRYCSGEPYQNINIVLRRHWPELRKL